MEITGMFAIAGIILFIGFLGELIFQKTNIPDVIWLMIIGAFLGYFFNFANNPAFYQVAPIFTTFALIYILFEGAINIDISKLVKGVIGGTSLSVLSFFMSLIIVPTVMLFFGWGIIEGVLLGAIIGGVSSAVIIPIAKNINIKPHTALVLTFESAISDVLCIVGAITIINIIELKTFDFKYVLTQIVTKFLISIFIGVIAGLLWAKALKYMQKISKSYMTTIGALLLLYSFTEFLGSSGAIACLSFGIIIGNSKKIFSFIEKDNDFNMTTPSAKFFFSQLSFVVKIFFFVYIGLLINFENLGLMVIGFLLTVLLFLFRPIAVTIVSRKSNLEDKDRIFMEILTPKGLAAAVLAQLPLQYGITNGEQFSNIVLSVIFFSILISTIAVFMTEKDKFKGVSHMLDLRKVFKKKSEKIS
jgi:potassium/hydrogen antiporter